MSSKRLTSNLYKSLTFLNESLHFFEKEFKKPKNQTSHINVKTNLHLSENNFKKPYFKKASIPLKMSSKSLVVFD
jgi:hypothetical protein